MSIGSISMSGFSHVVEQLMAIERRPILYKQQQQAGMQQQLTAIRSVESKVKALQDALEAALKPDALAKRSVTSSDDKIVQATADNGAATGTYTVEVIQRATQEIVYGAQLDTTAHHGWTGMFTINGTEIKVENAEETRLTHYARMINNADAGVTASVVGGRLKIVSDDTGDAAQIHWDDPDGILQNLGVLEKDAGGQLVVKNRTQAAADAQLNLDGVTFNRPTNSISDLIENVTINLASAEPGTEVSLTVEVDTQAVRGEIQKVINAYNSLIVDLENKTAKEAIFQGDTSLNNMIRSLRHVTGSVVASSRGTYDRLAMLGISTSSFEAGASLSGSLIVDTAKLDQAIESDPTSVLSVFTSEKGIFNVLKDRLDGMVGPKSVIGSRIQSLENQIDSIDDWTENYERTLEQREANLLKQFGRLEQFLAQIESQQMWLQTQLGSLFTPTNTQGNK